VEAFIASYLDDPNEVDLVRRRISRFVNYEVIFGRPGHAAMIHQVDAIVTSCGHAHHRSPFWKIELSRLGLAPERVFELTFGDIGGVLLERDDLSEENRKLFADISNRWTGINRKHLEDCAKRDPGVIVLALSPIKADVVLKCVKLGLVTQLIIDEDLGMALWEQVDPENQFRPHTLEVVEMPPLPGHAVQIWRPRRSGRSGR
jgi:hypothetical protein